MSATQTKHMRKQTLITVTVAVLVASTSFASLFMWNPKKRVPIPLSEALKHAEDLLGDDAKNRYCTLVSLNGNEKGDGKEGAWNLIYDANDGSRKHVYISMDGTSDVSLVHGPIDWEWGKTEGRRVSLEDVKERLTALFKEHQIDAPVVIEGDTLHCEFKTREFEIHVRQQDGTYSDQLTKIVGPLRDGFVIEASQTNAHDRSLSYTQGSDPYWIPHRSTYVMTKEETYLKVEIKYGHAWRHNFRYEIEGVFGEPVGYR